MPMQKEQWFLATYAPPEDNRLRLFRLLAGHNITAWTPEYEAEYHYPGRTVTRQCALFTGYFFIRLNLNHVPTDFLYQQTGFRGFVRQGNQLQPVPEKLVCELQRCFPERLSLSDFGLRYPRCARKPAVSLSRSEYGRLMRVLQAPDNQRNTLLMSFLFHHPTNAPARLS